MSEIKYTAESGHWYTRGGEPAYTVTGKNGKERNTTLRDARTMNLVPSVTTVLKVLILLFTVFGVMVVRCTIVR